MTTPGIVKAVTGVVKAIAVDGSERILQVGDRVLPNEQIKTGDNGVLAVEFSDGSTMDLGRNSDIILNENSLVSDEANKQTSSTLEDAQEEVAEIQKALAEDESFDPSKLEAPAAGGVAAVGGGAEDDGSSVVEIDYLNPTMTPYNGFDTTGITVAFPEQREVLLLDPDQSVSVEEPLPPPIIPPSIELFLAADIEYIKEDSIENVVNLNVNVDNPGTDILQTITITQLPADAILDLTGLSSADGVISSTGDGVNTPLVLTLDTGVTNFSGSFKLSSLEDSDVDITGISVTATAINANIPTLQASATDIFDVVVDAVLDEQANINQDQEALASTSRRGGETIDLNLEFGMIDALFPGSLDGGPDTDDSENVSSVTITIDDTRADLSLEQYNGSATLNGNSIDGYTLTGFSDTADLEAAIESLAIITPQERFYNGTIKGTIKTITEDSNPNGGLEPDLADNSREGVFEFFARVGDEFDGSLGGTPNSVTGTATGAQSTEIGFRITGSSLILDSANAEDQAFSVDFSQLLINPSIQAQLSNIDKVDISGNIGTQENNQLSLSAQDVLDFNPQDSLQALNIVGNTGDQVDLIDQDGVGVGSWSFTSHNDITQTDTYSYLNNGQIIADITIDDTLTVVM
jgi:hypothetical protein